MTDRIRSYENGTFQQENNEDHSFDSDIYIDELMDELENDEESNQISNRYREQRMQEIADHLKNVSKKVSEDDTFGNIEVITDESKLMKLFSQTKEPVIIHFELPHFKKCDFMNSQLSVLARRYLNTKFVRASVENCPFLVEKLNIKVLPFVVGYINGIEKMRLVGFSRLGNDPNGFELESLERFLISERIIKSNVRGLTISKKKTWENSNDSDSSLDL